MFLRVDLPILQQGREDGSNVQVNLYKGVVDRTARVSLPSRGRKPESPKPSEAGLKRRNEVAAKVEPQARPPSAMRSVACACIFSKTQAGRFIRD